MRNSDSGVVMSTSVGVRAKARRSSAGVSPERTDDGDVGLGHAEAGGRVPDADQRAAQVALDVDGERLHRRDVEDPAARQLVLGQRLGREPVERPEEGRQRLARAGGRDDQGVVAAADRLPGALLGGRGCAEAAPEPRGGGGGEAVEDVAGHVGASLSPAHRQRGGRMRRQVRRLDSEGTVPWATTGSTAQPADVGRVRADDGAAQRGVRRVLVHVLPDHGGREDLRRRRQPLAQAAAGRGGPRPRRAGDRRRRGGGLGPVRLTRGAAEHLPPQGVRGRPATRPPTTASPACSSTRSTAGRGSPSRPARRARPDRRRRVAVSSRATRTTRATAAGRRCSTTAPLARCTSGPASPTCGPRACATA